MSCSAQHRAGKSSFMAFSSSLPSSHYGQHGTFRANMSVLSLTPRFSALPIPWDLLRAETAQLV